MVIEIKYPNKHIVQQSRFRKQDTICGVVCRHQVSVGKKTETGKDSWQFCSSN